MQTDATIFHIALDEDIEHYQHCGEYRCSSLESEGFIHCCDQQQLGGVVNRYYQGVDNVQLMLLDPDKLDVPLIKENTVGGSELFPHIYGVIRSAAVKSILPFGLTSSERLGLTE
ncbi:MAG: DUF952 domain-containing protein [Granulosicoccus sp.]